jgi:3'(2'), 5'-bisphosphate nucleotidase
MKAGALPAAPGRSHTTQGRGYPAPYTENDMEKIDDILRIARKAGDAIMAVYAKKDFGIEWKEDVSPLTRADIAANDVIIKGLKELPGGLPVLSEESREVPYAARRNWKSYWLVDPLDGTKEFIKRNDEFTVNIALIEDTRPVLGVVYAPALGVIYYSVRGRGAFRLRDGGEAEPIAVRTGGPGRLKIVASRSHAGKTLEAFLAKIGEYDSVSMGSSLKFCLIAEGSADFYPRFGPTMEWDTGAAQCVVEEAGGEVTDLSGTPLRYNKPDLMNPDFVVTSGKDFDWKRYLE